MFGALALVRPLLERVLRIVIVRGLALFGQHMTRRYFLLICANVAVCSSVMLAWFLLR